MNQNWQIISLIWDFLHELKNWIYNKYQLFINVRHKAHNQKFGFVVTGAYNPKEMYVLNHTFMNYASEDEAIYAAIKELIKFDLIK